MSSPVIDLPDTLRIDTVLEVVEEMQRNLDLGVELQISAENLENIDFCGLQALAVFVGAARQRQLVVHWQNLGETLAEAASLTGMSEAIGLPG